MPEKGPLLGRGLTADVYAWGDGWVLKLFHEHVPERTVRREAQATRLVWRMGLAAPQVGEVVRCGRRLGLVMERIEGQSLLWTLVADPGRAPELIRAFTEEQLRMHAQHAPTLPSQRERLEKGLERIARLPAWALSALRRYLATLPDDDRLCHGDYHPDNVLVAGRRLVVLDWLTATRGNPFADLARSTLLMRTGLPPGGELDTKAMWRNRRAFLRMYLHLYAQRVPEARRRMERWLPIMAATRLNEGVSEAEKERLAAFVLRWLRAQGYAPQPTARA